MLVKYLFDLFSERAFPKQTFANTFFFCRRSELSLEN
jgi:hypothetical protein